MIRIVCVCALVAPVLWTAQVTAQPASKAAGRAPHAGAGLESSDPAVRRSAIIKLVSDRDPSAVAQLSLTLEGDEIESVRGEAAAGLGDLGDKRGIPALKRCLQADSSAMVKRSCRVSLARLDPTATSAGPPPPASAPAAAPASAPVGDTVPEASTAPPPDSQAAPARANSAQQFELRINLTAEEAAARPNQVYIDFVSAFDKSTLALGYERVFDARWSVALEPQLSADSASGGGAKASAVGVALAVRPHVYFLQQAPSGPFIAPFGAVGYFRATLDPGGGGSKTVVKGTTWAVGAGVGWSVVLNARAVFKLSAVFAYAKTAAMVSGTETEASAWGADFRPFISAGVMF